MSCICTKQTFIAHTKEGMKTLFPLHNSSSFQSNLIVIVIVIGIYIALMSCVQGALQ